MRSLLEGFFDTMEELRGDFHRRLKEIEREALPAPVTSARPAAGCIPDPDRFEEMRFPLGLRTLWLTGRVSVEPRAGEEKAFTRMQPASIDDEP